jgi:hypothetical protein
MSAMGKLLARRLRVVVAEYATSIKHQAIEEVMLAAAAELETREALSVAASPSARVINDAMVHGVCRRLNDEGTCKRCPAKVSTPYGDGVQGCYMQAEEICQFVLGDALSHVEQPKGHAVTQQMYEAGMKYLHGRGTAWCCTDLYLAMEAQRVKGETT